MQYLFVGKSINVARDCKTHTSMYKHMDWITGKIVPETVEAGVADVAVLVVFYDAAAASVATIATGVIAAAFYI